MKLSPILISLFLLVGMVSASTIPSRYTLDFGGTNGVINANNLCTFTPNSQTSTVINTSQNTMVNASAISSKGVTYAVEYETMTNGLYKSGNVTQTFTTPQGTTGVWVPHYNSATACAVSDLATCNGVSSPTASNNCMNTDDFSRMIVPLANSRNGATTITRMNQAYNTLIALNNSVATNVTLPTYIESRNGNTLNTSVNTPDTASDADGRITSSLFSASVNPTFNATDAAKYRALGLIYCAEMARYDFVYVPNGVKSRISGKNVTYFLSSGKGASSGGLGTTDFVHGGYFGDVMNAMHSCALNTGNNSYMGLYYNASEEYLIATNMTGTITPSTPWRVSPQAFKFTNFTNGGQAWAVCTTACNPDQADAADWPPQVSYCTDLYFQRNSSNVFAVDANHNQYCVNWVNNSGWMPTASTCSYHGYTNGTPIGGPAGGYYENGLCSQLNFNYGFADGKTRIDEAITHFDNTAQTFDSTSCMGVSRSSELLISFGRALGYDDQDHNITGTLINVTTAASNTTFCTAGGIGTSTNPVAISSTVGTSGQVLQLTSNTTAAWTTPAGSSVNGTAINVSSAIVQGALNAGSTNLTCSQISGCVVGAVTSGGILTQIASANLTNSAVNTTLSGINQSYKFVELCIDIAKGATVKNSSVTMQVNGLNSGYKWTQISFTTVTNPTSAVAWNLTASGTGTQTVTGCTNLNTVQHSSNGVNDVIYSGGLYTSDQIPLLGGRTSNLPGTNLTNITIGDANGNDINMTGYIRLYGMS